MKTYKTNPNIRCARCKGRLVTTFQSDGSSSETNLFKLGNLYLCKDVVECNQNIRAENTILDIILNKTSVKFKCNGHDIIEVIKK